MSFSLLASIDWRARFAICSTCKIGKSGAQFKSLHENWADTTISVGRLIRTILGGIAEFERELIRARSADGIRRAKAARIHMGRPHKLTKHQRREALARLATGKGEGHGIVGQVNCKMSFIWVVFPLKAQRPISRQPASQF